MLMGEGFLSDNMNRLEIYLILSKMSRQTREIERNINVILLKKGLIIDKNSKK